MKRHLHPVLSLAPAHLPPRLRALSHHAGSTALGIAFAVTLTACGGGATPTPPTPPAPQQSVQLAAGSTNAEAGGTPIRLGATLAVAGDISWSLGAGNPGALSAGAGASVDYLPPASVAAPTSITITATSGSASKSVQLTLYPAGDKPGLRLLAGDYGGWGIIDGSGRAARMSINSATLDNDGNLLTAERTSSTIGALAALRKVSPAGVVTTLLATPSAIVDGNKDTARLGAPVCPAAGPAGSVYFAEGSAQDRGSNRAVPIRKLASDGSVSTIASITVDQGDVLCLASDSNGKLYAYQAERISSISASGSVNTLAGTVTDANGRRPIVDGAGAAARFSSIVNVVADRNGNLYVNDAGQVVRKVSPDGVVSTLAGALPAPGNLPQAADGDGSTARFLNLTELSINGAGNLVALDYDYTLPMEDMRLRTITPSGAVSSQQMPYNNQSGLLTSPATRLMYLVQGGEINLLNANGSVAPFVGQAQGQGQGDLDGNGAAARFSTQIASIQADAAGNVYALDSTYVAPYLPAKTGNLRKVTPAGVVSTLPAVNGLSISGYQVARNGTVFASAGVPLIGTQDLSNPTITGGVVYQVSPAGVLSVLAGAAVPTSASQDGSATAARFMHPTLKSVDADGNLYAEDSSVNSSGKLSTIYRKITPAGVVTTIAALPVVPAAVLSDAGGNTYAINVFNRTIVRTPVNGLASVVAGTPVQHLNYGGDLPGYLANPSGMVQTGPYSFAIISGTTLMWLVAPH